MGIKNKKTKIGARKPFSGKSFYIALSLSLVAVGGAAWFGVNAAIDNLKTGDITSQETPVASKNDEWELDNPANAQQSGIEAGTASEESKEASAAEGYILPVKGDILNKFSGENMVKSKTLNDWVMHTGIDIKAAEGTPVKAIAGGTVKASEKSDLWGYTVTITHSNGIESVYCGIKDLSAVKSGATVEMGDVIGTVGNTAEIEQAEESHIHLGVKKNGEWIDPLSICKE